MFCVFLCYKKICSIKNFIFCNIDVAGNVFMIFHNKFILIYLNFQGYFYN